MPARPASDKGAGERFVLRPWVPHLSDLVGVLAGVKPVLYTDIRPEDESYIKSLCSRFGLLYTKPETADKRHFHFDSDKHMILIGRSKEALKAAENSWRHLTRAAQFEWGVLLGYPECCVEHYIPWIHAKSAGEIKTTMVGAIYENSRGARKFSFMLNNVFNFFSMPFKDGPRADILLYNQLLRRNRGIFLPALNVISWHPCSYTCAKSLRKGGIIFDFMRRFCPSWAAMLRENLSKPVLFLDKYRFLVFSRASVAKRRGGGMEITHGGLSAPMSLLDDQTLERVNSEKRLFVNEEGVFSREAERIIGPGGPGLPVFLDFGGR